MKKKDLYTFEEFADMYGVKVETLKKNIDKIHGIKNEGGIDYIVKGSRYPYPFRKKKYKMINFKKTVLKALRDDKYIDGTYFGVGPDTFCGLLEDIEKNKLIKKRDTLNHDGANDYRITDDGLKFLKGSNKNINININPSINIGVNNNF